MGHYHLSVLLLIGTLITLPLPATAAFSDFEDLVVSSQYDLSLATPEPSDFSTNGIAVQLDVFTWMTLITTSNGFARVDNAGMAGGSGSDLAINNVLLRFGLTGTPTGVDLLFGEYGGNLNLDINGTLAVFQDFVELDGMSIAGVLVTVPIGGNGNDMGMLNLSGPISSFAIGGQELWIDNVNFVPEPNTALLLGLGLFGLAFARTRHSQKA